MDKELVEVAVALVRAQAEGNDVAVIQIKEQLTYQDITEIEKLFDKLYWEL